MTQSDMNNKDYSSIALLNWVILGFMSTFAPFKYPALGVYYIAVYPLMKAFKVTGDSAYKVYQQQEIKQELKQEGLGDALAGEGVNLNNAELGADVPVEEEPEVPEAHKKFIELNAKDERFRQRLIDSLPEDTRSDKPVTYRYTAFNYEGKKEVNTFYAFSKMEVFNYLENEKYTTISVETSPTIEFMYGAQSFSAKKFKNKDLIFWLTQLSTYIKSGIPLTESMRILSKQMAKDANKKRAFDAIIYNLTLGESFSSALEKQGNTFPPLLINMIKAAEATGELEETLDDMAEYYNDMETTRKQMVSAMSYPLIIMVFSIGVIIFILLYVIPQFADVYNQSGAALNPFTLFILNTSEFLQQYFFYIALLVIGIIAMIIGAFKRIKAFRVMMQSLMMKVPVMKDIIIFKEMSIFAKTFSSLLKNNVQITESIGILTNITRNEIYRAVMIETIDNIAKGDKISQSFQGHWAVPDVAYYMIVTGESTGELAEMMARVADYYQQSHKAVINTMKAFIEPAMIIFLAVVVGGIVLAVILPMFGLYSEIG